MLLTLPAFAAKIEHTNVTEPKFAMEAPAEIAAIGQPTRLLERGGTLYVAGTTGIAALSADNKVIWTAALDPTGVREIAVDDAGIAYTGYELLAAKTSAWAFLGEMPKKLVFAPSVVGMLSPDGKKTWQVKGPESRISAPCLTPASIGVLTGQSFHIYARTDGKLTVSTMDLEPALLPNEYAGRMFRPRPIWVENTFVGGYFYHFYRIGAAGEEIERESKNKTNIVAGPFLVDGKMLIGSYSTAMDGSVNKSLVTLVELTEEFDAAWREDIADDHSATGDIVVDGDTIYASSNFTVAALDAKGKGKKKWEVEGKDGALSASSMRGVRFAQNFGYHYWGGQLMAVAGDRLYLGTRREIAKKTWADVITVLNKQDGSYVKTIDLKKAMVDMAVVGGRLVLATEEGLKFLALD
jgi:outer membrane protein assembly factor BamB